MRRTWIETVTGLPASRRRSSMSAPSFLAERTMSSNHAGSCLCGEVRYEVQGSFERFYLCHCAHCRKDTGSAHAANLFSSSAKLTWLSGLASVATYSLPGTRHTRSFCKTCGSALPVSSSDMIVVPAGSLDTDITLVPDGNIFTASRASWDRELNRAQDFSTIPT